jgi:hypothetical protein
MRLILVLMLFSLNAFSEMETNMRRPREEPYMRTNEVPGGGAINKDFLRGAGVTILLDMVSNTGWEIVKKAAELGNAKAQAMLIKYEDKVRQDVRDIQERDRLRDIERGDFDSPRVRIVHGNGRAVPVENSNPEY